MPVVRLWSSVEMSPPIMIRSIVSYPYKGLDLSVVHNRSHEDLSDTGHLAGGQLVDGTHDGLGLHGDLSSVRHDSGTQIEHDANREVLHRTGGGGDRGGGGNDRNLLAIWILA